MSQAFIREGDDQWLSDIGPSLRALSVFLTKENNGIQVTERSRFTDEKGREVFRMSNGLSYYRDSSSHWQIIE